MKLITYNVWFDLRIYKERIMEICNIIKDKDTDFVCLQEVTKEILILIREQLPNYYISRDIGNSYNTVILSKYKVDDVITIPFNNSNMGRNMHYVEVRVNGNIYTIITVHLESELECNKRFEQLSDIFDIFRGQDNVIIAGDINFKEEIFPLHYNDCWVETNQNEETRYTFDYTRNNNILGYVKERFDRVYTSKNIKAMNFELIGTESNVMNCPPSDHFGVYVEF